MSSHSNWLIRPSCHTVVICSHAGQKGAVVQPERRLVLQQCLAPVFAQHRRLCDVTPLIRKDSMHCTNSFTDGGGVEQGEGGAASEAQEAGVLQWNGHYKAHTARIRTPFFWEPFQSAGSKGALAKVLAVDKSPEMFFFCCCFVRLSPSAIYRVGLSGSIAVLICFQSSSSAPSLKSKIDMFSAAVPPPLCFSSVWVRGRSIAETCFTSCCAAYNYRPRISSKDYS